ncbi:MAG: serpin family protein [Lachnospiraceae bacterium]|nr:serpin family protein [Lachnospiraceae bacterium]
MFQMKIGKKLTACVLTAVMAASFGACGQKEGTDTEVPKEALKEFSYELLAHSLEQENPVLSPVSAYLALGMAGIGAKGETGQEFDRLLGAEFQEYSGELMERLPADSEELQVAIANSAWVDEELTPADGWMTEVKEVCHGEAFHRKLSTDDTMNAINGWIEEETNGLIKRFLAKPFSTDTRLALLNTVYFNGKWAKPFDADSTVKMEFTNSKQDVVKTEMMQIYGEQQLYLKNDIAEGVLLPYRGGAYSFVALKPAEGFSVRKMYEQLSMEEIAGMLDDGESRMVNLRLPKFEITFDKILNEDLTDMGLVQAFDPDRADFSGIGTTKSGNPLYIGMVRQKALIRVDEEGTEAAAVTMVAMNDCAMMITEEPINVFFDEPFLYMIVENETKVPLFVGILDDPTKTGRE